MDPIKYLTLGSRLPVSGKNQPYFSTKHGEKIISINGATKVPGTDMDAVCRHMAADFVEGSKQQKFCPHINYATVDDLPKNLRSNTEAIY